MQTAFSRHPVALLSLVFFCCTLCGCTQEWWSRGETPAPAVILARAEQRLSDAVTTNGTARQDFLPLANELRQSLVGSLNAVKEGSNPSQVATTLVDCRNSFLKLEQNLSPGSRAAYGELSGQIREFERSAREGRPFTQQSFELFSARAMFFLASELSVPAPVAS